MASGENKHPLGSITQEDLVSILETWKCIDCGRDLGKIDESPHVLKCGTIMCKSCCVKLATEYNNTSETYKCKFNHPEGPCKISSFGEHLTNAPTAHFIEVNRNFFRKHGFPCRNKKEKCHRLPAEFMRVCTNGKCTHEKPFNLCAFCVSHSYDNEHEYSEKDVKSMKDNSTHMLNTVHGKPMVGSELDLYKPWYLSMLAVDDMRSLLSDYRICRECNAHFDDSTHKAEMLGCGHIYCKTCAGLKEIKSHAKCSQEKFGYGRDAWKVPHDLTVVAKIDTKDYHECKKCKHYHPPAHFTSHKKLGFRSLSDVCMFCEGGA